MMHIPDAMEKTVKLPVVIEDGQVRYCYGKMPTLKDNTTGYLVVPAHALAESAIAEKLQQEIVVPLLPPGDMVLLGMRDRAIPSALHPKSISVNDVPLPLASRPEYRFVRAVLQEPLCLQLRGTKTSVLCYGRCYLPALGEFAESLNHAYSKASTAFEPYRRSHAGNVFTRGYFFLGNCWVQIGWLRELIEEHYQSTIFNSCDSQPSSKRTETGSPRTLEVWCGDCAQKFYLCDPKSFQMPPRKELRDSAELRAKQRDHRKMILECLNELSSSASSGDGLWDWRLDDLAKSMYGLPIQSKGKNRPG